MQYVGQAIYLSKHAQAYCLERGFTEDEVIEAICRAPWDLGVRGKWECRLDISYGKSWNGKVYQTKQIRPVFAVDSFGILAVTVYTYYF